MAKKNNIKPQQSPENYIRQKARNLPIYECRINKSWLNNKFSQIIVARQHANGNLTVCFYLVDLGCLGVKDSGFRFNIDKVEYEELLQRFEDNDKIISVEYALAHNIIYAALAYAEELGFKPCKEFTQTTRFMLEEDTDEIELIEIECGKDGKPLYVNSGFDNETRERQIINQLEKAVGKGNFDFIVGMEEEDKYEDEYDGVALDILRDEFLDLVETDFKNGNQENHDKINSLCEEICLRMCDDNLIDKYINEWKDEIDIEYEDKQINAKFLGLKAGTPISKSTEKLFDNIFEKLKSYENKAIKDWKKLEKEIGKTAFTSFLELIILRKGITKNYTQKLNEYSLQYSDYGLIKLFKYVNLQEQKEDVAEIILPKVSDIFPVDEKITDYEFYQFLSEKALLLFRKKELNLTEAFCTFLDEIEISDTFYFALKGLASISRLFLLVEHFNNESDSTQNETLLNIVHPNKPKTKSPF